MKTINWIKRKYPNSYKKICRLFDEKIVNEYMRKMKYIPAILLEDNYKGYKEGTLFLFKRSKEYIEEDHLEGHSGNCGWSGDFECHGVFKCKNGFTASGYHSVYLGKRPKVKILVN